MALALATIAAAHQPTMKGNRGGDGEPGERPTGW